MDIKNVYATVPKNDFYALAQRCNAEKRSIANVLAGLIKDYAYGGTMVMPKKTKTHHKPTGVNYNKEHVNGKV